MTPADPNETRRQLFQAMIEGTLDGEGERRVRDLLAADPAARVEFMELAQLHAWLHTDDGLRESLRRIDAEPDNVVPIPGGSPVSSEPAVRMRAVTDAGGRRTIRWVAAGLAAAAAAAALVIADARVSRDPASTAPPSGAVAAAAESPEDPGELAYWSAPLPDPGAPVGSVNRPPAREGAGIEKVGFNRDIRPILADNCFFCHGPDAAERKAGLRLDMAAAVFEAKTKDGRPVLTRFRPEESELWLRIAHSDPDEVMPPPSSHKSLTAEQRDLVKRWIAEGAVWEEHWAFIPPAQVPPPEVDGDTWSRNEIDRFVYSELRRHGLAPSPEADRRTLIRRLSFDLTGLPPDPARVEEFVSDPRPDAWELLVDEFLASPRYGEHRARYWLDAARYGDTHGLHLDNYREMWPYRDWVIQAYNSNLPFDRFLIEQLAGDLLPEPSQDQLVATGFNRCNVTTSEGGSIPEEFRVRYAVDRVETTSLVFLGLTAGCAVCHDHKFDPLPQREFYQLAAFFNNVTQDPMDGNAPDTPPVIRVFAPGEKEKLDAATAAVEEAARGIAAYQSAKEEAFAAWLAGPDPGNWQAVPALLGASLHLECRDGEGDDLTDSSGNRHPASGPLEWREVSGRMAPVLRPDRTVKLPPMPVAKDSPFTLVVRWVAPDAPTYRVLHTIDESTGARFELGMDDRRPVFVMGSGTNHDVAGVRWATPIGSPGSVVTLAITWDGSGRTEGLRVLSGVSPDGRSAARIFDSLTTSAVPDSPVIAGPAPGAGDAAAFALLNVSFFPRRMSDDEIRLVQEKDALGGWFRGEQAAAAGRGKSNDSRRSLLKQFFLLAGSDGEFLRLLTGRNALENDRLRILHQAPLTHIMRDRTDEKPVAYVLERGQYDRRGEEVTPGTPEVLPPMDAELPANRLGLARWMVRDDHPLTARVAVNRIWAQFFGHGIVRTSEDFGTQGTPPTHPELLDWLAVDFRANGWDIKRLIRRIVTSSTYRQSSRITPELLEVDPGNLWLARFPRMRLDAEGIRDQALALAGLLRGETGGPSVRPYQPPGIWEPVGYTASNTRTYTQEGGPALYRRSLYTFWKRTAPPVSMTTFDAPSREACTVRRERTNTPLQALALMNDVQYMEAARHFAARVLRSGGDPMRAICLSILARPPGDHERGILGESLAAYRDHFRRNPDAAARVLAAGESPPSTWEDPEELAAWTMLASQMLNLDESITKE